MTDGNQDLRTRIAAANKAHRPVYSACYSCTDFNVIDCCECGGWVGGGVLSWEEHLADAVIRKLGLRRVADVNRSVPQFRHAEWETDA